MELILFQVIFHTPINKKATLLKVAFLFHPKDFSFPDVLLQKDKHLRKFHSLYKSQG